MPEEPEVVCPDGCAYRACFDEDAGHARAVSVGENGAVRAGQRVEAFDLRVGVRAQVYVDAVLLHRDGVVLELGQVGVRGFAGEHESQLGWLEG
jgi:hypothetical protein